MVEGEACRSVQDARAPQRPNTSASSTTSTQVESYTLDINGCTYDNKLFLTGYLCQIMVILVGQFIYLAGHIDL